AFGGLTYAGMEWIQLYTSRALPGQPEGVGAVTIDQTGMSTTGPLRRYFISGAGQTHLSVSGGTRGASYVPGAYLDDGETDASATILFTGMADVSLAQISDFILQTPNPQDNVFVSQLTSGQDQVAGTSGGEVFAPLNVSRIGQLTVDTG